ncbi:hypothetical protein, partial [Caballeronia glebae]|uniref:hypothetical protein n=1 Tax=Caballeronia glebae TaxID=1777143 RepID=UPI0038BA3308
VYPGPKCLCGKAVQRMVNPKRQKSEDALLAIDAMAVELMQGKCPVMVEPGLIPMHARGYLLRQAHPNFVHLLRESTGLLNQVIGGEALALLNVRGHTVERLLGRLGDGLHLINPRQNIAFVYTVFGGWPGLKEEVDLRAQDVEAYEASGQHVPKRIRVGKDTKSDLIRRFNNLDDRELKERRRSARDFIQAALKANRCLTRTELFRMRGGKTHYLFALYMDEAWFLKALPRIVLTAPRKREVSVRAAFPGLKPTGKDADFAERIYEVCDALLETNPLKRITRACLLNNSRNESIKGWAEKSPSVREALEACVDSDEEFIERRLGYVCEKVAEISILHPYALKSSYRGLSNLQIIQRIKRALTWLKKHLG